MPKASLTVRARRCIDLLRSSQAAANVLARRYEIKEILAGTSRRIWPTARVARMMGISNALLRKWMEMGCLPKRKRRSPMNARGIRAEAVEDFLRDLARAAGWGVVPPEERPRPKAENCLRAAFFVSRRGVTPKELAKKAKVSVSLVRSLIAKGELRTEERTTSRILVSRGTDYIF